MLREAEGSRRVSFLPYNSDYISDSIGFGLGTKAAPSPRRREAAAKAAYPPRLSAVVDLRTGGEALAAVAQACGRHPEVAAAERREIGLGGEVEIRDDGRYRFVGHEQLAMHALGETLLEPLSGRTLELFEEPAAEGAQAHAGERCELLDVANLGIMFEDEVLEVVVPADDGVEKIIKFCDGVITVEQGEKLLAFDVLERDAAQVVLKIAKDLGEECRKVRTDFDYRKLGYEFPPP